MIVGPESEDRGVEPHIRETIEGEEVRIELPHELDALGNEAAPEDDMGQD